MATTSYTWVVATQPFFMNDQITAGSQYYGAIAGLAKGGYFSAWGVLSDDFVQARVVSDNGAPLSSEFGATSTTDGDQEAPAAAGLRSGRVVMSFTDASEDVGATSGPDVSKDGGPSGIAVTRATTSTTIPTWLRWPTAASW